MPVSPERGRPPAPRSGQHLLMLLLLVPRPPPSAATRQGLHRRRQCQKGCRGHQGRCCHHPPVPYCSHLLPCTPKDKQPGAQCGTASHSDNTGGDSPSASSASSGTLAHTRNSGTRSCQPLLQAVSSATSTLCIFCHTMRNSCQQAQAAATGRLSHLLQASAVGWRLEILP